MSLSSTSPKRIHLKGSGRHEEGIAGAAIKPGHLVMLDTDGDYVPHNNAYGKAERLFALEDALQGKSIDDSYASGDIVAMTVATPGDEVYAWLAAGEHAVVGEQLVSAGTGAFMEATDSDVSEERLVVALEEVESESSAGVETRIKVRVL
jgi:hypothetical protein